MASNPFAAAARRASVSEEAFSTIGKGKGRSLPVSLFTFQVPSKSASAIATTPEDEATESTWDTTSYDDSADAAGNTTPKLKPRRVSTSSLPSVAGPSSHWAFRDEMGILNRSDADSSGPSRPTVERAESSGGLASSRRGRPRKALSMSADARHVQTSMEPPPDPAPKRARRNMWTDEETRHLVEGCKVVRFDC